MDRVYPEQELRRLTVVQLREIATRLQVRGRLKEDFIRGILLVQQERQGEVALREGGQRRVEQQGGAEARRQEPADEGVRVPRGPDERLVELQNMFEFGAAAREEEEQPEARREEFPGGHG